MWTYSDWITYEESDPATARSRLRSHIKEVSDKISADIGAHGYSRQNHPLTDYYGKLTEALRGMRSTRNGGRTLATFPKS